MTIFDTLRYPISYPPTEEELKSLPQSVYTKWLDEYWAGNISRGYVHHHIVLYYSLSSSPTPTAEILRLRQMIREME